MKNFDTEAEYPHFNSTIVSHAFYNMWHDAFGAGFEQATLDLLARIWYRSLCSLKKRITFVRQQ